MAKILIVEDNQGTNKAICEYMKEAGHTLFSAFTGSEALKIFRGEELDIIVLDIMLPEMSGIVVLHEIRKVSNIPVIMLTALDDEYTQSNSFDEMADDYITKPFNILEVKARIKAILRRSNRKQAPAKPSNVMEINGMKVELDSRRVFVGGKELNLTAKEFDLLELLMAHPNKVYSRNELLNTIWGDSYPGDARTVDVHVRRLREKIEANPGEPVYIHTKWGVGYFFKG